MCWKAPEVTAEDRKWNGQIDDDGDDNDGVSAVAVYDEALLGREVSVQVVGHLGEGVVLEGAERGQVCSHLCRRLPSTCDQPDHGKPLQWR
jgi:hypothetical protein